MRVVKSFGLFGGFSLIAAAQSFEEFRGSLKEFEEQLKRPNAKAESFKVRRLPSLCKFRRNCGVFHSFTRGVDVLIFGEVQSLTWFCRLSRCCTPPGS